MRFLERDINLKEISPLTLSFIGDSVYELLVREKLVCQANRPVGVLSDEKVRMVNCKAQALVIESLLPYLTEEETDIYKRGKNAHTTTVPKNARNIDYHRATGLEALFGYVYLKGDTERLRELFCLSEKLTEESSE